MSRANIWDDALGWVSMTGGAGEEDDSPDNTYLRLDGANNPASPNDFIRSSYVDGVFLPLSGGTLTGDLVIATGSSLILRAPNETSSLIQEFDPNDDTRFRWRLSGTNARRIYSFQIIGDQEIAVLSDYGHVFYRTLDMSNNRLLRVGNPSADTDGMSRGYNDGRYSVLSHTHPGGDDAGSMAAYTVVAENNVTVGTSDADIMNLTLTGLTAGKSYLVELYGMVHTTGVPSEGAMLQANPRINNGGVAMPVYQQRPTVSASSHSHSSASHLHHMSSTQTGVTESHSHLENARNTNSTTPGSTGSATPAVSASYPVASLSVVVIGALVVTPSGSTIACAIRGKRVGAASVARGSMWAKATLLPTSQAANPIEATPEQWNES